MLLVAVDARIGVIIDPIVKRWSSISMSCYIHIIILCILSFACSLQLLESTNLRFIRPSNWYVTAVQTTKHLTKSGRALLPFDVQYALGCHIIFSKGQQVGQIQTKRSFRHGVRRLGHPIGIYRNLWYKEKCEVSSYSSLKLWSQLTDLAGYYWDGSRYIGPRWSVWWWIDKWQGQG